MKFLSVCSGIEAASVAWHPLGWKARAISDIEAFPNAVTAHHYPDVPNLGDMTKWREWDRDILADSDILVGGTPCQAFSVAGLRNSLSDERGNLSLEYVRLADAIDAARSDAGRKPAVIVWENVPGVLSVKDNAFGCFLAALAGDDSPYVPPRGKWTDAGVVIGPERAIAWRILDAQYFGLAQRRRRVFVVASARDGFDPAAVLLECEGLRRDTPPRREAGQGTAHSTAPCLTSSGRGVERTGDTRGQDPVVAVLEPSTGDISHCLNAGGMGRQDYETETLVTHSLRGEGFDASEDGTGRGTPLVPVAFAQNSRDEVWMQGGDGQIVGALAAEPGMKQTTYVAIPGETGKGDAAPCVAVFNGDQINASTQEADAIATLRALRDAVGEEAFAEWRSGILNSLQSPEVLRAFMHGGGIRRAAREAGCWMDDGALSRPQDLPAGALLTLWEDGPDGRSSQGRELAQQLARELGQTLPVLPHQNTPAMAVRRLTPKEAERLQGFPDNYTAIPWRGKPASECPDGPRYKALGNSMAVPVMAWIGKRIAEALK